MFDLIVKGHRTATGRDIAPLVISWAVHALAVGAIGVLTLLFTTDRLPPLPNEVLTYVVAAAPPPPPPPPPPVAARKPSPVVQRSVPTPRPIARAPVVVPDQLPPAVDVTGDGEGATDFDSIDGVAGGVPGGVPGGVIGGVVGGIADVIPLPPAPKAPVRTGGQIQAPALVKRVPPVYPPIAVNAQIEGVVILEATVGRDGRVEDVTVLRSVPLLDKAAIDAVRQWVYAPLLLNGQTERFVLTVTVSFGLAS